MQGGAPASFSLPQFRLLPSQTHSLDFPSLLATAGLKNFTGSINLVLDTQGKPGLLMAAGSVDQSDTYVFEVAPKGMVQSAAKSVSYWSTANGNDTMVTIWNPADEAQNFIFRLTFSGGHYDLPLQMGPRNTRTFNVSEIIANQVPDAQGNIIPASIQEGSAKILGSQADNEHILVVADAGTYNVRKATCGLFCFSCDGATSYSVNLNPFGVGVGANTQESLIAHWSSGGQYDVTSGSTWNTSDTTKATVQTGLVHGVAVGSFVLSGGNGTEPDYSSGCYPEGMSCPIAHGGGGNSPGNTNPKITSISPNIAKAGVTGKQLTINGSGFGTSPTVNLPTGFSKTQQTGTDTQISITVNIAKSAVIGVNNISVTASGLTSNSVNFTTDGPYYLVVITDQFIPNDDGFGNGTRNIGYQVKNFSGSDVTSSIPVGETNGSDSGWNCTNHSAPSSHFTACGAGKSTDPSGTFTDGWGLQGLSYTPVGCGFSTDTTTWNWCDGATFTQELTVINGYIHNNAVKEFGVVNPPNAIASGTAEPH